MKCRQSSESSIFHEAALLQPFKARTLAIYGNDMIEGGEPRDLVPEIAYGPARVCPGAGEYNPSPVE